MTGPIHLDTGARALDALPAAEAAAFDAHLAGCPECATELAGFTETTALLGAAAATPPPPTLWPKVAAAIAVTPQLPPVTGPADPDLPAGDGSRWHRSAAWWRRPTTLLLAAAAVVAAVVVGVVLGNRGPGQGPLESARACVAAAPDARVLLPSVGTGGSVDLAPSCAAAVIQPAHLPQAPAGKAYQLWVLAGTAAHSAGMLAGETSPDGTVVITGLRTSDTGVAVTLEPAGGSKTPTSEPVWIVPLHT